MICEFEAVVNYDGKFCSESCKWLYGGTCNPWCYLFGMDLDTDVEGSPFRLNECIKRASQMEDIP